jgi:hypothetical protein
MQFIVDKSLGVMGLALLGFMARSWVNALESKFDQIAMVQENRAKDLEARLTSMEGKYRDVLDIVLSKFSAWEDRIANLLLKVKDSSPAQLKDEVDKFRAEAKNDIDTMKLEVERVRVDVNKIAQTPGIDDKIKTSLVDKLTEFERQFLERITNSEKRISLIIKMVGTLNNSVKTHEFKINNLTLTMVSKSDDSGN